MNRKICVITGSRAEYGLLRWVMQGIKDDPDLELQVIATGMHLSPEFGLTFSEIEADGFQIDRKVEMLTSSDTAVGIAKSMGLATIGMADALDALMPDLIVVLGDRYEIFASVAAALVACIPVAHLHGGETTLGAIDDKFRHAITCMSSYHFTSNSLHAERVSQIINSEEFIYDVGATAIDSILSMELFDESAFHDKFSFRIDESYVLSTIHPETVDLGNQEKIEAVINAFDSIEEKVLCTLPNADTEGTVVRDALLSYEKYNPNKIKCFENLGQKGYLTAMKNCSYMLGNTSSGIIEACSFNIPVVNVGDRQKGRLAGDNVVHTGYDLNDILKAVEKAKSFIGREFVNPYGKGDTANQIIEILEGINK